MKQYKISPNWQNISQKGLAIDLIYLFSESIYACKESRKDFSLYNLKAGSAYAEPALHL